MSIIASPTDIRQTPAPRPRKVDRQRAPLPTPAWGDLGDPRSIDGLDEVVVIETQTMGWVDQQAEDQVHPIRVTVEALWVSPGGRPFTLAAPPAVRIAGLDAVDPDADGVRELARLLTKAADFLDRIS